LPIFPESEYYHQNGNYDPQHSKKLIDVTHVIAFHLNTKTKTEVVSAGMKMRGATENATVLT